MTVWNDSIDPTKCTARLPACSLEEVVIRALEEVSGLQGSRIEGLTGVWVGQHKLAAIGVRAKQ